MEISKPERRFIISIIVVSAIVVILNQTLLLTAIPEIMNDLNIEFAQAQWLNTAFFLVNGIMIPVSAFFINKFTTRSLFLVAMGIFMTGTLIAALSSDYFVLLAGRIIQAISAGIMMPLTQVILLNLFPVSKRGRAMGLFGMVIGVAPAVGPVLGGFVVQSFEWSMLFWIVLPIAAANFIFAAFTMRNVTTQTNPKFDLLSLVLSILGFGSLLYGFSAAGTMGWSDPFVIGSLIFGAILVSVFVRRQLNLEQPILQLRVMKSRAFTLSSVIAIVFFTSIISGNNILPVFMQEMLDYTPLESGLAILPGAFIMGLIMPIAGYIFDRYGIKYLTILGSGMLLITSVMMAFLDENSSFWAITIIYTLRLVSVGFAMMPLTTYAMNSISNRLIPDGTALNNTMRQIGASLFTAIMVTIMTLIPASIDGASPSIESQVLGVNATFLFSGFLALLALIMAFFLKELKDIPEEDIVE
ncbi:MDR family MFS transporter [Aliicoccus persicus]|uniref:Drug resistance transporter, EmrB/QacA subfamily n=1 Tax=Aliicoccus persicus TaxID=930138 RepID=A0A662Z538_9STAP|nr:MDR family MFS transporter [Aliicoccus persicus]SEW17058.1 drug resistance transporter, EmrB/QacA subfamily [Aliicoccus persicus]